MRYDDDSIRTNINPNLRRLPGNPCMAGHTGNPVLPLPLVHQGGDAAETLRAEQGRLLTALQATFDALRAMEGTTHARNFTAPGGVEAWSSLLTEMRALTQQVDTAMSRAAARRHLLAVDTQQDVGAAR